MSVRFNGIQRNHYRAMKPLQDGVCRCQICEKERGAAFGETCTPGTDNKTPTNVVQSYPTKLGSSTVVGDSVKPCSQKQRATDALRTRGPNGG